MSGKRLVGTIGVDSGMLWVGDPGYIMGEKNLPDWARDWKKFVEKAHDGDRQSFTNDSGVSLGLCFDTGYDGLFPVYAVVNEDGEVTAVTIEFS